MTGLRFVLNTDNSIVDMRGHLRHIYAGTAGQKGEKGRTGMFWGNGWVNYYRTIYLSLLPSLFLPPILEGIWVEHVVKNPQYKIGEVREGSKDGGGGSSRLPPAFAQKLEEYVTGLPGFK